MQELYNKLKKYTLKDAIEFEEKDRQYLALKNLYEEKPKISNYLWVIIANSIICYQLSWKWEDYWEEFSDAIINYEHWDWINWIYDFFSDFLNICRNNKRFVQTKLNRIKKLMSFFDDFEWKENYYYDNLKILRNILASQMWQKKDAKTIVFAVKMFSYWARNIFWIKYFPNDITIPVDSRLQKIFEKYKWEYSDIGKFYSDLSKNLWIPELHLDAILWNSRDLI